MKKFIVIFALSLIHISTFPSEREIFSKQKASQESKSMLEKAKNKIADLKSQWDTWRGNKKEISSINQEKQTDEVNKEVDKDNVNQGMRLDFITSIDKQSISSEERLSNAKEIIKNDFTELTQGPKGSQGHTLGVLFNKVMGKNFIEKIKILTNKDINTMSIEEFNEHINDIVKNIKLPSEVTLTKLELRVFKNNIKNMTNLLEKIYQNTTDVKLSPDKEASMTNINETIEKLKSFNDHNIQYNIIDEATYKLSRLIMVIASPFIVAGSAFVGSIIGAVSMPFVLIAQDIMYLPGFVGTGSAGFLVAMAAGAMYGGFKGIEKSTKILSTGFDNLTHNEKKNPRRTVQFNKAKKQGLLNELKNFNAQW